MIGDVPGHTCTVVSHEQALFNFTVQQDLRIERVQAWSTGIADPYYVNRRVVAMQGADQPWREIFVNQLADLNAACCCSLAFNARRR